VSPAADLRADLAGVTAACANQPSRLIGHRRAVRPVRGLPAVQPLALLAQAVVLRGEVGDVGAQLRHATQQIEVSRRSSSGERSVQP